MLRPEEKSFFIYVAAGASNLSECSDKRGAVIVRDRRLLAYGYNRKLTTKDTWEISAIYDAIFGTYSENLENTNIFCTYFPSVEDIKLIVSVGVYSIYFMGVITEADSGAVRMVNQLNSEHIPLEIVQLQK
jgi:deoxycytidylate deaminase